MNKQNGFATLEIILIIGIIAIFSTVAVPKMARILDKVALNYELKHLYSELNLARSIGKSSMIEGGIFNNFDNTGNGKVELLLYSNKYSNSKTRNRYMLMRQSVDNSKSFFFHKLTNDIKLDGNNSVRKISFNNAGTFSNPPGIELISKYNNKAYIYLDTVGRIRGSYVKK